MESMHSMWHGWRLGDKRLQKDYINGPNSTQNGWASGKCSAMVVAITVGAGQVVARAVWQVWQ